MTPVLLGVQPATPPKTAVLQRKTVPSYYLSCMRFFCLFAGISDFRTSRISPKAQIWGCASKWQFRHRHGIRIQQKKHHLGKPGVSGIQFRKNEWIKGVGYVFRELQRFPIGPLRGRTPPASAPWRRFDEFRRRRLTAERSDLKSRIATYRIETAF